MRKVVYGGACSLDGFLTGPNGEMDWLHFSTDVQAVMADTWARTDTVLFGRKTWEVAAALGQGGGTPGVTGYLFSRTLSSVPAGSGVELVREEAGAFVRALKARPGKDIVVMSGGSLARALLDAGVVDEVGFNVHPVLLGGGVPALGGTGRIGLTLSECRTLDGGCVLVTYRVTPAGAR